MNKKWYVGLVAALVVGVAAAVAYAQGQIIVTTLTGTELFSIQTSGPQSAATTANTIKTFVGSGGTPGAGAFTTLSASSTVSGTGFATRFAVPGPIGSTTASTGAFTTLGATGAVTLSPANLAVTISPSGTGTVAISPVGALTIAPTAASTIDNASIGVTTPLAGKFTTLAWTGLATGTFGSDTGQTATATVCEDTTTHAIYFGSGSAGVCKGTSSMRFKENIGEIAYGLPEIMQLRPVSYTTKAEFGDPTNRLYGFLAEDTAVVMPQSVTEYDAKGDPSSVDYIAVIPVLVKAIQQQQAQIDQLKRQLQQ